MGWIMRDYLCECGHSWEDLVKTDEQDIPCPECARITHYAMSSCAIATYSIMDKEAQKTHMLKRSSDHTKKLLKQDPTSMKMSRHVKKQK